MPTALVTGANRGLGLAFTEFLNNRGDTVIATRRGPSPELEALGVHVVRLEVADEASVESAATEVRALTDGIDLLVNNAGYAGPRVGGRQGLDEVTQGVCHDVLMSNVAGPLLVTKHLKPLLGRGSKIANISSGLGSIDRSSGRSPIVYSASKAALNMVGRILAEQLHDDGITVLSLSPGWVRTDMGGQSADLSPTKSIEQMMKIIDAATLHQSSGKFYGIDGQTLPF
jgi:NAD(P)-dependent dehydrogenase (short-subunit alcohol dehydrogenase family)